MTPPAALVIVPTFNERDNLPVLVGELLRAAERSACSSSTTDRRTARARLLTDSLRDHPGRVEVMHRTGRRGLGRSYIDGIAHAVRSNRST